MPLPSRILDKIKADEQILYTYEKPFASNAPGLIFTDKRLIYYKPKSSGLKMEDYSWRDVHKISIEEGFLNGEIEFELEDDQEIELEDIPNGSLREMYSLATELRENARSGKSRSRDTITASSSRAFLQQSAQAQIGQRGSNVGLLPRIWTMIQCRMNRIMGLNDPIQTLDLAYEKQLNLLQSLRLKVAEFSASKERILLQKEKLQLRIDNQQARAKEALLANKEDLARKALEDRALLQAQLAALDSQIAELEAQEERLLAAERRLAAKIESFNTRKETLKAEYSAAEAQVRLTETLTGISEEMADVGLAVQHAEERTEDMKARNAALDELLESRALNDLSGGSELDREMALIKAKKSAEDELERLRAEVKSQAA